MVDIVFQHLFAYVESVEEDLSMMHDNHRISKNRHGVSIYLHVYFDFGISILGQNMSKEVSKNDKIRTIIM